MRKSLLLTAMLACTVCLPSNAQVIINELMQSNIDCTMDDLNDFPDSWVELYNSGDRAVNLSEYRLGLTDSPESAWALPYRQLSPHNFVLVYCDKVGKGLHTDFKLESGKGAAVYLFHNDQLAERVEGLAKQPAPNISWGRQHEGTDIWGYQASPTPAAPNCGTICEKMLGEPLFSEPGKVVTDNQTMRVELSLPERSPEGTVIRYTTDGSEPTENSPAYSTPFVFSNTRIIRAKLFCPGYLSPRSTTHSYIYFPREMTLPVVSIVTDGKYLYDNKIGIYVQGSYKSGTSNYKYDWRRPINFELFDEVGRQSALNQLCETRVQGGASRDAQLKSLVVYANKRFGTKRLKYEFFPDQRPGQDDYKSVILRNAGNDFDYLYMRDAIIQRVMATHTDLDWQAWRPAVVYFNGTYKGILNIRERSTGDNIYTNYNGLEDIDMIENWSEIKEGDDTNWNQFKTFYAEQGHTLEDFDRWMDWKEFINLMIMNLYYNNQDFPGNNIVMWRPRAEGGKWRFVAKDTDFGLGLYDSSASYNSIEWIYDPNYDYNRNWANKYEHTRLFRRLMDIEDFRDEFIERAFIYMGDFLNAEGVREIWDPMYDIIKDEYPYHRRLINQWWPNYTDELSKARNWAEQRGKNFSAHLQKHYQFGALTDLVINPTTVDAVEEPVDITVNGIRLSKPSFNGQFPVDRVLTVSGQPANGRKISGWNVVKINKGGGTTTEKTVGATVEFTIPSTCMRLILSAMYADDDHVDELPEKTWTWSINNSNLCLQGVAAGTMVKVYTLQGMLVGQAKSDGTSLSVSLPNDDIYLLKVGDVTIKIIR